MIKTFFVFAIVLIVSWFSNIYMFTKCDFESPYKCEAIHVVGIVFSPLSIITTWSDVDEK